MPSALQVHGSLLGSPRIRYAQGTAPSDCIRLRWSTALALDVCERLVCICAPLCGVVTLPDSTPLPPVQAFSAQRALACSPCPWRARCPRSSVRPPLLHPAPPSRAGTRWQPPEVCTSTKPVAKLAGGFVLGRPNAALDDTALFVHTVVVRHGSPDTLLPPHPLVPSRPPGTVSMVSPGGVRLDGTAPTLARPFPCAPG